MPAGIYPSVSSLCLSLACVTMHSASYNTVLQLQLIVDASIVSGAVFTKRAIAFGHHF